MRLHTSKVVTSYFCKLTKDNGETSLYVIEALKVFCVKHHLSSTDILRCSLFLNTNSEHKRNVMNSSAHVLLRSDENSRVFTMVHSAIW